MSNEKMNNIVPTINISGQGMDVGEHLSTHIKQSLQTIIKKYFNHVTDIEVSLNKKGHFYFVSIVLHEDSGRHMKMRAEEKGTDSYQVADSAINKIERQFRKYNDKLHNLDRRKASTFKNSEIINYTLEYDEEDEVEIADNPVIIAEKQEKVQVLSVKDAVMQMDLMDLPAMLFVNSTSGDLNLVYYRKDGNISWVDAKIGYNQ